MEITLSLKELFMIAIGVALLVLIIYLIKLAKNLCTAVKKTTRILDDFENVSSVASTRALQADELVGDVIGAVGSVAASLKGNQSITKAAASVVNSATEIIGAFNGQSKGKCDSEE